MNYKNYFDGAEVCPFASMCKSHSPTCNEEYCAMRRFVPDAKQSRIWIEGSYCPKAYLPSVSVFIPFVKDSCSQFYDSLRPMEECYLVLTDTHADNGFRTSFRGWQLVKAHCILQSEKMISFTLDERIFHYVRGYSTERKSLMHQFLKVAKSSKCVHLVKGCDEQRIMKMISKCIEKQFKGETIC